MINVLIVGASGYVGAELTLYLSKHFGIKTINLAVSKNSKDANIKINKIHNKLKNIVDLTLTPLDDPSEIAKKIDVVFLATDHKVSHELVPVFLLHKCVVFDLSGSFRMKNIEVYHKYYTFSHKYPSLLNDAIYGLAEFINFNEIKKKNLIAVPGCYPTAVQIGLKPLILSNAIDLNYKPIVNAISGISGSGRVPSLNNSYCEVGLKPYKLFHHRHQPEIEEHLGIPIVFNPHIGNFSRGIIATITCRLKNFFKKEEIQAIYSKYYSKKPLVRLYNHDIPNLNAVIGFPFCDIGYAIQKEYIVIVVTEDNLLKGAASQAIQCFNIKFRYPECTSLL
ncbi:N-acetyl-gamma-glutamyl-phosphate reductase [Buchnera aphidicola (Thelaxes suberi)]|uniref:N-acetyl-gamma-glutamyl-phosphate reductase n=1 Tax=Buchnera aphidicola TaxID=9 RepID=UPI0034644AA9